MDQDTDWTYSPELPGGVYDNSVVKTLSEDFFIIERWSPVENDWFAVSFTKFPSSSRYRWKPLYREHSTEETDEVDNQEVTLNRIASVIGVRLSNLAEEELSFKEYTAQKKAFEGISCFNKIRSVIGTDLKDCLKKLTKTTIEDLYLRNGIREGTLKVHHFEIKVADQELKDGTFWNGYELTGARGSWFALDQEYQPD